jgi:predicted nucleic acid-binding protein
LSAEPPEGSFVVVDASLWVARLVTVDAFHSASKRWMAAQALRGVILLSPALLLAETAGAIARRTQDSGLAQRAVRALRELPGLRLVEMERDLMDLAAQLAAELGLRGADACYVALAARLGLPFLTLDQDQRQRSAGVVSLIEFATE